MIEEDVGCCESTEKDTEFGDKDVTRGSLAVGNHKRQDRITQAK